MRKKIQGKSRRGGATQKQIDKKNFTDAEGSCRGKREMNERGEKISGRGGREGALSSRAVIIKGVEMIMRVMKGLGVGVRSREGELFGGTL